LGVRFSSVFPEELVGRIDPDIFYELVDKVNKYFLEAERISFYSVIDSILGCLTAYLIFLCIDSHYERCIKKVSKFIAQQNKNRWIPSGLYVTDPKDKGLRVIEITLLDEREGPIYTAGNSSTLTDHDHHPQTSVRAKLLDSIDIDVTEDEVIQYNGKTIGSEEYALTTTPKTSEKAQEKPLLSTAKQSDDGNPSSRKPYFETALDE
jgi:hypothetical protein